jgi:uncharacterized protein YndB with AHSA1/START domain
MAQIHAHATKVIEAPPEKVYRLLANFNESHPAILPPHVFFDLVVEQGGIGAGTVVRVNITATGATHKLHVSVNEPEPGRIMVERDPETGLTTTFTVETVEGGKWS